MENMDIRDINQKIDKLNDKIEQRTHQTTLTMIGVIVSIWAVTLITASTLYIVTH